MAVVLVGALVIGLTLGMLGSGGSAITVPVLIYLVGHGAKESIAESMAIVGLISIAAAIPYAKAKLIDWRSVWFFGIPGMLGTLVGAWLGGLSTDALQLFVFGSVLLVAAFSMLRPARHESNAGQSDITTNTSPTWKIGIEGTIVGVVTGFVGVGGGFLIVPALVLLANLPMRLAIGTSLVIIAIKSGVGFAKYEQHLLSQNMSVDLQTIATFVLLGVIGSLAGRAINARLNQQVLRHVFATLLILLGGFLIIREGSKLIPSSSATAAVQTSTAQFVGISPAIHLQPIAERTSKTFHPYPRSN
jgi:uncharacterized membrane protein YfcA